MNKNNEINLALKDFTLGNKERAYKKLKKIFNKNKDDDQLRFNLAVIEQSLNLNEDAKANYLFLIKNNKNLKAMINLYLLNIKEDNFSEALLLINKVININNNLDNLMMDKAFVLYKLKKYDESINICKDYLNKKKDINCMNILGLNYFSTNDFDKAENILKKALSINKNSHVILNSLGRIYHEKRDSNNAEKYLSKAYSIKSDSYEIINNLAGFYREEGKYNKSIELYNNALKLNPKNPSIINNLAKAYFDIDNFDMAEKYSLQAYKLNMRDGNIQKILSLIYLRKQDYKKGWNFFDGRLNLSDFIERNSSINKIRKKLLTKNKINPKSKILVLREQGVGDEILYGTMYYDLLRCCENVTIECDKRLMNIFKNSFPEYKESFLELGKISQNQIALDQYDYAIYAGSLGKFFRNNINNFNDGCFLYADDKLIKDSKNQLNKLKEKYNIGISWKSFKNRYAAEKSLNLENIKNIFNTKNCNFINLQYGDVDSEILKFNKKFNQNIITLKNLDLFNDFDKLAGVLKNLDLFISVSNSTAHLAGSLGVKTLLIKPTNHAIFHYWNQPGDITPWYKSIKLLNIETILEKENLINSFL